MVCVPLGKLWHSVQKKKKQNKTKMMSLETHFIIQQESHNLLIIIPVCSKQQFNNTHSTSMYFAKKSHTWFVPFVRNKFPVAFYQDCPVLENATTKFQDFPGFLGPVRTLIQHGMYSKAFFVRFELTRIFCEITFMYYILLKTHASSLARDY